tara:strand:- start:247 stop:1023 length:777 start_codon:yes stop_codon:yes gene_type:complete
MKVIKELKGNSGCGVFLIEDEERGLVVRKIAGSSLYSARLEQQYFKQKSFSHNLVKAPKIFKSGVDDDLFYFDMEYVKGESFHNFISTHTPAESLTILKSIFSIYKSNGNMEATEIINRKIDSLIILSGYNSLLRYCSHFDWSGIPQSDCHGDLSLENIIIKNNTPYLIDFLDSFIDTNLIDISKVFSDLMFGWSWRKKNNFPFVKNIIILQELQANLTHAEKELHKRLICLHLLRALPYSKDALTKDFLKKSLDYFL